MKFAFSCFGVFFILLSFGVRAATSLPEASDAIIAQCGSNIQRTEVGGCRLITCVYDGSQNGTHYRGQNSQDTCTDRQWEEAVRRADENLQRARERAGDSGTVGDQGSGCGDRVQAGDVVLCPSSGCYNACKESGIWPFRSSGTERRECRECLRMGSGEDSSTTVVVDGHRYRVPRSCVSGGTVRNSCRDRTRIENCIDHDHSGRRCEYSRRERECVGDRDYDEIVVRDQTGRDCPSCRNRNGGSFMDGLANVLGAIAPPLAYVGATYLQTNAMVDINQAWAGAAQVGYEQCTLQQQNYTGYVSSNELPGVSPQQLAQLCNGYGMGGFAGMGGMGGMNPWIQGGYSPGFMNGMMGPYGPYGPGMPGGGIVGGAYAVGGIVGGMVGGMAQGGYMAGGYPGGMAGGYPGGMVGGMAQGGYMSGGYPGGMVGGMAQGGYMAGGYPGGMVGGMAQGGYMSGGYPGGMVGGMAQGGYMSGGYPGGMVGGMAQGGYMSGGYPGGMAAGMAQGGGLVGGGSFYLVAGAAGGAYTGGGLGGYGGYGSGTVPYGAGAGPYGPGGGYFGATGGFGAQPYYQNQQAAYMGAGYQQMARAEQFGMMGGMGMGGMGGMGMGGFGSAGFSPVNAGFSLQAGVGLGFF